MVDTDTINRRNVLKGIGAVGAVGALGGVGTLLMSNSASATAGGSIDNPDPVTSDDGTVTYVAVHTTGRLTWDGFDRPARQARLISRVKYKRGGNVFATYTIHDTGKIDLTTESWGGSGEEISLTGDHKAGQSGYIASDVDWGIAQANRENVYNDGYGLPSSPAPTDPLAAEGDGETQETRVMLESEYRLYAGNGAELTGTSGYPDRPTFSEDFVVSVTNQSASTGSGGADAEGDTGDSAEVGV